MQRVALVAVVLAGCGGGGGLVFEQENNYEFTGELGLETVTVQAQTDLTIDWSAVTTDIRGREMTTPPDQSVLLNCAGSKADIRARLDNNTLVRADCLETFIFENDEGGSSASTTQFSIAGNPLDSSKLLIANDPAQDNWIASILSVSNTGDDPLMTVFVDLEDAATETEVALTDSSATFSFTVDLTNPPVTGSGTIIDWGSVTTDVFGNDFNSLRGSQVLLARYDIDLAEIEGDFLRIEDTAAELYRMAAFGFTTVDLTGAVDADDNAFTGFTDEGVWLMGVTCPDCLNPAPLLLTVVEAN